MDLKENLAYNSIQIENVSEKKSTQKMTDGEYCYLKDRHVMVVKKT